MLADKLINALKKVYPHFGLKDNDIIFASYPKSGNTWVRFIWYNIINIKEFSGKEINFHNIDSEFAAEYDSHSYGYTQYESLPRLVKTHESFNKKFKNYRSLYLYRDPRDVMVSYYHYINAMKNKPDEFGDLTEFIRSDKYGIPAWGKHLKSWMGNCEITITYEELQNSEIKVLKHILNEFRISNIEEDVLVEAIEKSKFDNMRSIEERKGRPNADGTKFKGDHKFVRKGKVGEGTHKLNIKDRKFIKRYLEKENLNSYIPYELS